MRPLENIGIAFENPKKEVDGPDMIGTLDIDGKKKKILIYFKSSIRNDKKYFHIKLEDY